MSKNKIIGIALIIIGIALCLRGYHYYVPAGPSAVGQAFGGITPKKTYVLISAGLVTFIVGIIKVI